eukprot:307539-Heterocapsa_arctica.AAC.1
MYTYKSTCSHKRGRAFRGLLDERALEAQKWPLKLSVCAKLLSFARNSVALTRTSGFENATVYFETND